jgi:hypothetical protein
MYFVIHIISPTRNLPESSMTHYAVISYFKLSEKSYAFFLRGEGLARNEAVEEYGRGNVVGSVADKHVEVECIAEDSG